MASRCGQYQRQARNLEHRQHARWECRIFPHNIQSAVTIADACVTLILHLAPLPFYALLCCLGLFGNHDRQNSGLITIRY